MKTTTDGNVSVPRHLQDVDLISYLDGELERAEQESARAHLEGCWNCRSRLLAVQNSIENFLNTRRHVLPDEIPPAGSALSQFRRRLAQHQSAPVSLRLQIAGWLSLRNIFRPFSTYPKTALAAALLGVALVFVLVDPFKWNAVSADELLTRASAYEFLNETAKGKVVRQRARFVRLNLKTNAETLQSEIETDADNLSSALYVSFGPASGGARRQTVTNMDQPSTDFLSDEFQPETAAYLVRQGWVPQVSISLYKRLIAGRALNGNDGVHVQKSGSDYEIYHAFAASHASRVVQTIITLNSQTYAPKSISIFTDEGDEQFVYRFTRVSIESIERTPEVARLFEIAKTESGSSVQLETRNSKLETEIARSAKSETAAAASADLEVEVLRLLHQAGADLGEQVGISRTENGPVRVSGIVETDQRKNEILRALQPVAGNAAVHIDVKTVAEARAESRDKTGTSRPTTVEGVEIAADTFPAYQDLRARMSDEEARVFAARMVSRSHSAMRHAWALKRLMSQFSAKDLATLQPDAHAKWIALIKSHAREFENESRGLREQLQAVFEPGSAGQEGGSEISNDAELMHAVARLVTLASTNYEVVRSAFTLAHEGASSTAIKSPQFWHSLRSAEAVAASIGRAP